MANVTITQLPTAGVLTGTELVPVVQNGVTVHTTTAAIAASPSLTQTFLTLNNEPTLANSRYFSVSTGLGLTDNGAQSNLVLSLNGASGSLETAGNGFAVKTGLTTVVGRSLTTSGNGLTVTNGNGAAGNPVFSLTGLPQALSNLSGGGFLVALDSSTILQRSISGTADQIVVADGDGLYGIPTIGLANNPVIPGTAAMKVPVGTTAQRPAGQNGQIRYNTDISSFEVFEGGSWSNLPAGAITLLNTGYGLTGGPITTTGTISVDTSVTATLTDVQTLTNKTLSTGCDWNGNTVAAAYGGTGFSSYSVGDIVYASGATALSQLAIGTSTYLLTSSGTAPQWSDPATVTVGLATTATNVAGGAANQIVFNTGAGATSFITAPTVANTFLEWSGSALQWSTNPLGTVTSVDVSGGTTGLTTSGGPITTSGTITLAGTLVADNGGTGLSSYLVGDMVYYAAGTALSRLAIGGATFMLTSTGTAPQWSDPTTLTVGNATYAANVSGGGANQIVYNSGTGATTFISAPTVANTFLEWSGSVFQWSANPLGTVTSVDVSGGTTGLTTSGGPVTGAGTITLAGTLITSNGGTGVSTYTAGDTLYFSAGTALSKLAIGAGTYVMTSSGTAPQWTDPATITVGSATSATSATTATNLAGGAAGSIPYQTASGTTAMLATSSGVLVGGTTPSYSTAPSLTGTNFTSIPNAALQNSSITIGTTAISLGASSLTLGGLTSIAVTQDPTTALQVATKQYVDGLVTSGITYHAPVKYEVPNSTGNLNAIYNNGTGGVGATLTNNGTLAAFAPDGPTAQVGDRILVYNQTNQFENGVYEVTTVGDGSTAWVLTRTADADSYGLKDPNALGQGDAFFVTSGNTGAGETYECNTVGTITFGTTAITFVQISSAQVYTAGTGLTLTGTQFSLTTPVVLANGGTGLTSYTAGDLPYFATGTAFSKLAIGATNRILTSSGTAPQWTDPASVTVGAATSATTATNVAGGAANQIVFNTAASTTSFITAPTLASTYLKWNGSAFAWDTAGTGTVTSVDVSGGTTGLTTSGGPITGSGTITLAGTLITTNGGTGLSSYTAGDLLYYSTGTTLSKLAIGTNTYLLTSSGSAPQWTIPSSVSVGSATTATNVAGGAANQIVYNTGASTTAFIAAPTVANTFLEWTGSAFQWATNPLGTVTSVDVSGGSTGLTFSGGPITTSGTITMAGTLAIANGGTNATATPTAGAIAYGTGTAYAFSLAGTASQVLLSGGTGAPTWSNQSALSVGTATNATNATNIGITNDTTTNATMYPVWVTANTGSLPAKVTSTKLSFNPSTGVLTATGGISGGTF